MDTSTTIHMASKAWQNIDEPVVPPEKDLYGHALAGSTEPVANQPLRLTFSKALQGSVEIMATLQHTTARITHKTTHVHTNINNLHTNRATHHKTNHAQAAAWRRAETAFCVAPVSRMPDWQAAQATGSVLSAQRSLERTCQRGLRKAGPNRRGGLTRHSQVWSTLEPASSASRVRAAQEPSPSYICRRPS